MSKQTDLINVMDAITVDGSNNVGIGTSSPSSYASTTLEIKGSSTTSDIKMTNTTTGVGDAAGYDLELNGNDINYVNRTAGGNQKFWTNSTERMRIDAVGRVTTPYQPAFCTTGNSFSATIFKGTVLLNNGNYYDTSTGRFSAPVAGLYAFSFNQTTEDTNSHFTYISVNGGNQNGYQLSYGVIYQSATQNIVVSLAAGDYVEGRRRDTGYNVYRANFSGYLIG